MRVRYSRFVKWDLAEITAYIAEDSPRQAVKFVRSLRQQMRDLSLTPMLFRLRPEIGSNARLLTVGKYVILDRVFDSFVRIERVVHGNRDLENLLDGDD